MRIPNLSAAVAASAATSMLLLAGAAPAFATNEATFSVKLRQSLPRTATDAKDGVPQKPPAQCPGIPEDQDGWHFVLPTNKAEFVKLTVTFKDGGTETLTDFGPPSAKHAYVGSAPGDTLIKVEAEVKLNSPKEKLDTGLPFEKFNLSHTCPAVEEAADDNAVDGAVDDATGKVPEEVDVDVEVSVGGDKGEEGATGAPEGDEKTSEDSESGAKAQDDAEAKSAKAAEGDLAETGNSAPVAALGAAAAALVGAGGYLVLRRRKAAAVGQQD
ncbi:LPXTG cell wall anchor domain-containing protein [Streptomyces gobiensis]|uniref:LPXTG cell wall anchor domain-containing protein n=1 Tax=Streptomyces gobiensis TaxID=2875706 RepID=UPI001E3A465A|nr:LPXTG cell wall anchor domain-containing protein [Streptomyces gobiensis]UGY93208.1 LPXTG cell wall anchor domain-containing protein [Streptomyces gobiensis]